MSTVHDDRYRNLIDKLRSTREAAGIRQGELASKLGVQQSLISKVESRERRLDIIEFFDWLGALSCDPITFLRDLGWASGESPHLVVDNNAAIPVPGRVESVRGGINQILTWQGQERKVFLEGVTAEEYLAVESHIVQIFKSLADGSLGLKNREAIYQALSHTISALPNLNPSDAYHHIVYRLYLREYNKTNPEQSWVRAGGEAMELFVQEHYAPRLAPHGVRIQALFSGAAKAKALAEMGLSGKIGDSKLDVALYGTLQGREVVFGGVHCKASLAERVSDDVPCSEAMMRKGLVSILYTFDAKSYPPPTGDLINRGELGTPDSPSDKRLYVESHGSFDNCFSYNTRTTPSAAKTQSGKRIFVSTLKPADDAFPAFVVAAWKKFAANLQKTKLR